MNPVTINIPDGLKDLMKETMERTVPSLYDSLVGEDRYEQLKKIFYEQVFQANDQELTGFERLSGSLVEKDLQYLHRLYTNPDISRVSNIVKNPAVLAKFRDKMMQHFKNVKRIRGLRDLAKAQTVGKASAVAVKVDLSKNELVKFNAPQKQIPQQEMNDEIIAKLMQKELDKEDHLAKSNNFNFLLPPSNLPRQSPSTLRFPSYNVVISYLEKHPLTCDPCFKEQGILDWMAKEFSNQEISGTEFQIQFTIEMTILNTKLKLLDSTRIKITMNLQEALRDCAKNFQV